MIDDIYKVYVFVLLKCTKYIITACITINGIFSASFLITVFQTGDLQYNILSNLRQLYRKLSTIGGLLLNKYILCRSEIIENPIIDYLMKLN